MVETYNFRDCQFSSDARNMMAHVHARLAQIDIKTTVFIVKVLKVKEYQQGSISRITVVNTYTEAMQLVDFYTVNNELDGPDDGYEVDKVLVAAAECGMIHGSVMYYNLMFYDKYGNPTIPAEARRYRTLDWNKFATRCYHENTLIDIVDLNWRNEA